MIAGFFLPHHLAFFILHIHFHLLIYFNPTSLKQNKSSQSQELLSHDRSIQPNRNGYYVWSHSLLQRACYIHEDKCTWLLISRWTGQCKNQILLFLLLQWTPWLLKNHQSSETIGNNESDWQLVDLYSIDTSLCEQVMWISLAITNRLIGYFLVIIVMSCNFLYWYATALYGMMVIIISTYFV